MISDYSLTITVLNIRSIKEHMLDVLCDQHLIGSDFLCLTETQLQKHDDLDQIKSIFNGQFTTEFNINEDKYKSIAICYKDNISILNHVRLNGISVMQFQKSTFADQPINLAVVYRSPSSSQVDFVNYLTDIVEENKVDILLGDFNIIALHDTLLTNMTLQGFQMIVTEPTHIDGGLIDHVYLRNSFMRNKEASGLMRNIYFSNHDAFKCKIYLNNSEDGVDFSINESAQE